MNTIIELDSYLGTNPICDICKELLKVGDEIIQKFVGKVVLDSYISELGVKTEPEKGYTVVHVKCRPVLRMNKIHMEE